MAKKGWDQRRGAKSDSRVANRYVKGVEAGGGGCLMALLLLPFTALLALLRRK